MFAPKCLKAKLPSLQFSKGGSAAGDTVSLRRKAIELERSDSMPAQLMNSHNASDQHILQQLTSQSAPVIPGQTGESEAYSQPFQLLSWYPR